MPGRLCVRHFKVEGPPGAVKTSWGRSSREEVELRISKCGEVMLASGNSRAQAPSQWISLYHQKLIRNVNAVWGVAQRGLLAGDVFVGADEEAYLGRETGEPVIA